MAGKSEEKTIPFLRRLVEMLQENEDAISFVPGERRGTQKTVGRIVIHDRILVETEILPKYFNHASFASLRRQLNYFHFVRVGKGRQRGATYRHDAVIVMDDILRLKRRSAVEHEVASAAAAAAISAGHTSSSEEEVSISLASSPRKKKSSCRKDKKEDSDQSASATRPTVVSPSLSMESSDDDDNGGSASNNTTSSTKKAGKKNKYKTPTIVLDLTQPTEGQIRDLYDFSSYSYYPAPTITAPATASHNFYPPASGCGDTSSNNGYFQPITPPAHQPSEEEVLEGCSALLALNCQPVVDNKNARQISS
mmetsp:Transcript_13129/g.28498  ORF Transcript_13129/g.28498 Transcript_13129/m.28498 type:complete len:309 (-) Transcript_13129:360-1286(-)